MIIKEIIHIIETFAPLSLQENYDNSGLQFGNSEAEVKKVLITLDITEAVVDEAGSDNLSVEDLMLFLQKLTRGEYPEMFEGIDQAKFMSRFNTYRDERWDAWIAIRDAKVEEYKRLGDSNNFERTNPKDASTLGLQLEHYKQKVQERGDERKSRKQ